MGTAAFAFFTGMVVSIFILLISLTARIDKLFDYLKASAAKDKEDER